MLIPACGNKQALSKIFKIAAFGMGIFFSSAFSEEHGKSLEVSTGFETGADTLSLLYLAGSYYRGHSKVINYIELNYASEWFSPFVTDHPTAKRIGIFAGHQFQARWRFLYLPAAIGISGGAGVDRGGFLKTVREDSTCIFCSTEDYYERREYVSVGVFSEITPSIYINGFHLGLKAIANYDTRYLTYGGGLSFGIPLEVFESE